MHPGLALRIGCRCLPDAGFVNKPLRPRRSCGAAGDRAGGSPRPHGEHSQDRVLRFFFFFKPFSSPSETQIEATSTACGTRWCQQFFKKKRAAPPFPRTSTTEWPNFESVSSRVRHFFPLPLSSSNQTTCTWLLMKVVLRGQNQDAFRSTLWGP